MRKRLLSIMGFCIACGMLTAQAQSSSSTSGSSSWGSQSQKPSTSQKSSQFGSSSALSPTGRMQQQELRASQIKGAKVDGSSGQQIGTIKDVLVNPNSGRIDFAIVSLSSSAASAGKQQSSQGISPTGRSSSETSSQTSRGSSSLGTSGSSAGYASSGKEVAVPWMLLRSSSTSTAGTSTSAYGTSESSMSFTYKGDVAKLESAPAFQVSELSQPNWRQQVYSHFGLSSATGAGEYTPGGTSTGTSQQGQEEQEQGHTPQSGSSSPSPYQR